MYKNNVTIGIAGTADSSGGLQVLINIDSPLDLKQDPIFDESFGGDFIIELRHTAEFVSLRYFARPSTVHSYQSGRDGRLWIGMTIPKGKRFANNVSPYTVLMDVLDTLRQNYMDIRSDGSYEFKTGSYWRAPFDELLEKRYPLEDFPGRYVEMCGDRQAVLCSLDEETMSRFFADTQYPEFERLSSVLVSPGHARASTIQVDIPRPLHFSVVYPGGSGTLTSPDQRFERTLYPSDSVHDPVDVSFTLSELRKGAYKSWVKVDEVKEEVHLNPVFPERSFRLNFEFRSSTGNLADIPCELNRFYLFSSHGMKSKRFQFESGRAFAVFVGLEAEDSWDVQYEGTSEGFQYSVRGLSPKSGELATVTLTPHAPYQGIKFSGAQFLRDDTCLEIVYANRELHRYPVSRDSEWRINVRKQSDVQRISLVSERYAYPELKRVYDPVSGWDKVVLPSDPVPIEKSASPDSMDRSGMRKLVVENHRVELRATIDAVFSDKTTLRWGRVILDRQAGGEEKAFILPPPYGTKKKLEKVILSSLRDGDDHAYMDLVFAAYPATGELPLNKLDAAEGYKIVIDSIARPSMGEVVKEWMNNRVIRNWGFVVGLLLALAVGVGSCLAWQRYIKPKLDARKAISSVMQQGGQADNEDITNQGENEGDIGEEESPEVQEPATAPRQPAQNRPQVAAAYVPAYEDSQKIGLYYDLMTKLESSDGQPLTFSKVREIDAWQEKIYEDAQEKGQVIDTEQLMFIHEYIPYFSRAVTEIEKIKNGTYRGKTVDEYKNSKELSRVNNSCLSSGEALRPFRVAIQNLYIIGEDDINNTIKMQFIRRAVLSGAPRDKKILADVDSFKGISDKYNNR